MNRGSRAKKRYFGRILLLVFISLFLGIQVYLWNARSLGGNHLPMPFGYGMAVVLSGSMSPTLETNDLILVQKRDHYEVGDIVVYQSEYKLIVHRLIAQDGDTVTTQGDANPVPDEPVDASAIRGAVAAHIPFLGTVVKILKIPAVALLILIGACVLLEMSFQKEKQADEESLEEIKAEIRRLKAEQEPGNKE